MAAYDITTANSVFAIATSFGAPSSATIDSNHFLISHRYSSAGYAQALAVNTSTWAVTTAGSVFTFDTGSQSGNVSSMSQIDSNHFLLTCAGGESNYLTAFSLVVDTSTWAVTTGSTPLTLTSGTLSDATNCNVKIDTNHFLDLFALASTEDLSGQVLTVNTTTWAVTTAADALVIDTTGNDVSVSVLDANHFFTVWSGDAGKNACAQILAVNTSTWAVTTAGSRFVFLATANTGYSSSSAKIDDTHFIVLYRGADSDGFAQILAVNTSTWAVTTAGSAIEIDTDSFVNRSRCVLINSNHAFGSWGGSGSDGYSQVLTINTSTWEITTTQAALEFDTTSATQLSVVGIDTSEYLNIWRNADSAELRAQVLKVELPAAGPANLKSYNTNVVANIKTINTNAIANVKTLDTNA